MQVKPASFPIDSGLVPVLTTTPILTRMNGPKETEAVYGDSNGISGPIEYRSQCNLLMLRGNWPERLIDSNRKTGISFTFDHRFSQRCMA